MTPKERAAMQQALEALEICVNAPMWDGKKNREAITALREALAEQSYDEAHGISSYHLQETEQVEQEPVGNMSLWHNHGYQNHNVEYYGTLPDGLHQLYAAPVRTKDLTDEEIKCACGDLYPADSFGAGFIAATGRCQNCDAVHKQRLELSNEDIATIARKTTGCFIEHEDIAFARAVIAADREKIMGKTEDDYNELWNQDDPWAPTDEDTRGDYDHDIQRQQELDDADWPTDSK